jgi:hypothetical protein
MDSALYFPFTAPKSELFLKNALFFWDSVDFIVPWSGFRPYGEGREVQEALELIAKTYIPTAEDKVRIHDELMDICTSRVPESLLIQVERPHLYDFYPQKMLPETWDMLRESNLAHVMRTDGEISRASTVPLFGYYMMSIVAVCCANGRKRLVTDEPDPYRSLANALTDTGFDQQTMSDNWHGRLVALTLGAPDLSSTSLSTLLHLRKHEDALLQHMRRTYVNALDKAVNDLQQNTRNPNIQRGIIASFTDTMEKDLKELKLALRRSTASILLSPLGGVTLLASLTSSVIPGAKALAIGGLYKALSEYKDRRRKILREHSSAWLFAGTREFKIH